MTQKQQEIVGVNKKKPIHQTILSQQETQMSGENTQTAEMVMPNRQMMSDDRTSISSSAIDTNAENHQNRKQLNALSSSSPPEM